MTLTPRDQYLDLRPRPLLADTVAPVALERHAAPVPPQGHFSLPLQDALRQFDCTRLVTVEQIKAVIGTIPGFGVDANARKTPPPGPRIKSN